MQITLAVFKFNLLGLLRNLKSSGIMFIIPVVFMGVFAVAFGGDNQSVQMKIGIFVESSAKSVAPDFEGTLKQIDEESENLNFQISTFSSATELEKSLRDGQIGIAMQVTTANEGVPFEIKIQGKESSMDYIVAKSVLVDIVNQVIYADKIISTEVLQQGGASESVFNQLVPGLIVYGVLILIPGIAQGFAAITEKKYIQRLAYSKAKARHIIAGSILYYMLLGAVQVVFLYGTATIFGYRSTGNPLLAIIPGLLTVVFVIGLGLLIGSYVKKTDAATNIGTILSIILGFFSGSFISGIGSVLEFNFLGRLWQINDIIPSKWSTVAMEKILADNLGLADIAGELAILSVSGFIFIVLGILIYYKRQLSVES